MKRTFYFLLVSGILLFISGRAAAQEYKPNYQYAVGLKFGGYENGISGKYFMDDRTSLEGLIGIRSHGVVFTGLYELNQTAFNVDGFKFYYGFGAHLGGVSPGVYKKYGNDEYYESSHILLGLDGVIGLDYVIPGSPIAVSLDLNPRIELASGPYFDLAPGLGIKYVF